MTGLPLFLRHGMRDLRGGMRHLRLLCICLVLGVTVMGCIGSLVQAIYAGIDRDGKSLLGGDIEVHQLYKPLAPDAVDYLSSHSKQLSILTDMRAMATVGDQQSLIELKGVDQHYPLYGTLELTDTQQKPVSIQAALAHNPDNSYGVAVEQSLLDTLNLALGQRFTVGDAAYIINAITANEPDRRMGGVPLGPRVLVSAEGFAATHLITYGTLINYRYRVALPETTSLDGWKKDIAERFPGSYWNLHDWHDASPGFTTLINRLGLFFSLTGLTALVVAGLGIGNATSVYIWRRRATIATMKCLGASARHVRLVYLMQIIIAATLSIIAGLVLATLLEIIILHFFGSLLPVQGESGIYLKPLLLSAAMGLATVLLFSLWPLAQAGKVAPAALFRGETETLANGYERWTLAIATLLIVLMSYLAIAFTGTVKIPLYFSTGLLIAMGLLYALSAGLKHYAQRMAHRGFNPTLAMALSNLARPGAATSSMVIALGLAISLMVALALIGGNLRQQIERGLPERAPAFFFVDIQPSAIDKLIGQLTQVAGVTQTTHMPIVRGHIIRLNDVPVNKVNVAENARWAIQNERGLTTAAQPPENSSIIAGAWWDAHYQGPPLVSFDAALARGMGLKIGDKITLFALDKEITATITNLRDIQWGSMEMNFAIILSPGSLDGLPVTYIATVSAPQSSEKALQSLMRTNFPDVGVVRIREVLGKIADMLTQISNAVLLTAAMTILCGAVVMGSAIHASLQRRLFDTAMLKVLGATRGRIGRIYLTEFTIIALAVALVACVIGTASAYGVMQLMVFSSFTPMPFIIVTTLISSLLLAIFLGWMATRITLRVRPLTLLRNE